MTETTVGREPIQIVEILQPFCANTFGVAPCTATGTADQKCYNTRGTCIGAAGADFVLGTPLSLFFSSGMVAEQRVSGAAYIFPTLVSVSTTPTAINIAGANPDASGLGNRAVCNIVFQDHQHTDRRVDPYVAGRSWDPLSRGRGSFWTRWLVRNKYRQNIIIKVYEGYVGQALSGMVKRTYFLQSISGPDDSGRVTVQGKDVLSRIEERKAQAPAASPGRLFANITSSATSFVVTNAVVGDYPAPGTIRVGSEIMTYSATAADPNGVSLTVVRGTDNSVAATHNINDTVQVCLRVTNQAIDTLLTTLLNTYGGVDTSYLDTANWALEVSGYRSAYLLNSLITEPTAVSKLVAEIQEQTLVYLWWDERLAKVGLRAVRGLDSTPPLLTAETHILEGSYGLSEKVRERTSQVWIYFARNDYVKGVEDSKAYQQVFILSDIESEGVNLYGEPSIRKIFARWLSSSALANTTASKILLRYVDVPSVCTFSLDAKDRAIWVGDVIQISHHLDVDQFGARRIRNWIITSAEETLPGEVVQYEAEDTTLYGTVNYVMATGAANYPGAALKPFKNAYVGNSAGLLSDGSPCARIT
ncbi:MAG: hypothetical protein ACEQSU_14855 [Microgenomates group bacterium]